ncbi:helix-turn-helix domain-containing protein [Novosphingobium sp. UBA1939]|uniref:helix-turn-helix domain-containing protein n=1 Tax=Novosphingobium sp. UBA1939 TaxID=1946982 RepID=UPI0025E0803C|nr:helix-turn-helix transcriptional regulator [Novosphingobium sp. UBA1939]
MTDQSPAAPRLLSRRNNDRLRKALRTCINAIGVDAFASTFGISPRSVERIINGERDCSLERAQQVADFIASSADGLPPHVIDAGATIAAVLATIPQGNRHGA